MTDKPNLYIINTPPPPETQKQAVIRRVRNMPRPRHMVQCMVCGGRECVETKTGVFNVDGKFSGGTKILLCACCLLRGERSVMF